MPLEKRSALAYCQRKQCSCHRAPIGDLAIAEVPAAANQGFVAMIREKRLPNIFALFW